MVFNQQVFKPEDEITVLSLCVRKLDEHIRFPLFFMVRVKHVGCETPVTMVIERMIFEYLALREVRIGFYPTSWRCCMESNTCITSTLTVLS